MKRIKNWKGKYVKVDIKNPCGLGVCDESGLVFNREDLEKQMEWRGDNLVWTGLIVGKPYLDKPNEQNRPPLVKNDPKAIKNPRLPKDYTLLESNKVLPHNELLAKLNSEKWEGNG